MQAVTSLPVPDHAVPGIADVPVLTGSIAQRASDVLLPTNQSMEPEKTLQSEGFIDPSEAIEPILGELRHPNGPVAYSFEREVVVIDDAERFKFHGRNANGDGFIISGSIFGDRVNIQHILAQGFGSTAIPALERHLALTGIKTCYATFTRLRTANAFINHYGYQQIFPEDIPQDMQKPLAIDETTVTRIRHSTDDFREYSETLRKREEPYGTYSPEETKLKIHFEDKQILMRKDISQ